MKIAISSSDGENVNLHFGKSHSLYIYDFNEDDESLTFIEKRTVDLVEDEKHQGSKILNVIGDCEVVISTQVGFKSKILLEDNNIKFVQDQGPINEVLDGYVKHYMFMKKPLKF